MKEVQEVIDMKEMILKINRSRRFGKNTRERKGQPQKKENASNSEKKTQECYEVQDLANYVKFSMWIVTLFMKELEPYKPHRPDGLSHVLKR